MASIILSVPELYNAYKAWIIKNPQSLGDYETSAKWVSYFIAGRINNSHVVSELVYCLSNLLVLFNDRIIYNSFNIQTNSTGDKIKLWLTVLEYSEVFLELSAKKLWGEAGKWLIVVAIQVLKCASRLILIYRHKENIIQTPPVPMLDRRKLPKSGTQLANPTSLDDLAQAHVESVSFTLKRSGRVVRKVDSSPPLGLRTWKPMMQIKETDKAQIIERALAGKQLIAETFYVTKPIVHLATMACFGRNTWKPWLISLVMDLASLQLYGACKKNKINCLTPKQRLQLSRRTVVLLLYLIRSPFYDKYSGDKINRLLEAFSSNVPLTGLICKPLMQYIPFWQSNYFYMWST